MADKKITYGYLVDYLEDNKISADIALGIIERALDTKSTGHRFHWKMTRFTLYIWERVKEDKDLFLKPKIDTVREVVSTKKYKRLYDAYPNQPKFDHQKEVKNFAKLVSEPRQQHYFKEGNFFYEGTKRPIPQSVIDRIK
jgi:hypothetical protein